MRLIHIIYSKSFPLQLVWLSCLCIQASAGVKNPRTLQAGPAAGANITWTACTVGTVLNTSSTGSASYTFGSSDCDGNAFTAISEASGASVNSQARVLISATSGNTILRFDRNLISGPPATFTKARFKSTAGDLFKLNNLTVYPVNSGNQTLTVTAYKAGVAISGSNVVINYTSTVPIHGTTLTSTDFGNNYNSIDEVQVTSSVGIGVSLDDIQTAAALPVTFTYFTGQEDGHNILLSWGTGTESNVKNFEIEQSVDGSMFFPRGSVDSKAPGGNSSSPIHYNYTDILSQAPLIPLFYRLKEFDLDGRYIYSPVLKIGQASGDGLGLSVYPNPFRQQIVVSVTSPEQDKALIRVTDMTGRLLLEQANVLQKGSNILYMPVSGQWGKGAYLFNISTRRLRQTVVLEKIE